MFPQEINLPASSAIIEPQTDQTEPLSDIDIIDRLTRGGIQDLLTGEPLLVIINDHHRATPSTRILKCLNHIAPENSIGEIAIATGTHTVPSDDELNLLVGGYDEVLGAGLVVHSAEHSDFVEIGLTSRGTPVRVNSVLTRYNMVLCINSVEPHYFAGYTGGIKSIVPGLAALETVERNHSWALHHDSGPTLIEDNPLQIDLWEAGDMLPIKKLGIQMVTVGDSVISVSYGDLKSAFLEATKTAEQAFTQLVKTKFDLIVSIVYPPLNRSLYQAQKGIENTVSALREGGELILVAECPDGIGNTAFYDTLITFNDPDEVLDTITREDYKFGDHKVYKFALLASKSRISIVGNLSSKECANVFADKLYLDRLEEYLLQQNQDKKIAVVLDAGMMVLKIMTN